MGPCVPFLVTTGFRMVKISFSEIAASISKNTFFGGGGGRKGGAGRKKLRTIRLFAKPPPP